MGVDHNAYIGPYLRVTEVVTKQQYDRCADCNRPDDVAYCPKCGRSKKDRIYAFEGGAAPDDWEQDYEKDGKKSKGYSGGGLHLSSIDIMSPPNIEEKDGRRIRTYLYLPNGDFGADLPSIEGEEEVPFDELDVSGITKKFTEFYKDEMKYIEQWFEVEVKFGYLGWCS